MKKIVFFTGLAIVICTLFPPWYRTSANQHPTNPGHYIWIKTIEPVGYGFITTPPKGANGIDFGRLGLQYIVIAVTAGGSLYLHRKDNKNGSPEGHQLPQK